VTYLAPPTANINVSTGGTLIYALYDAENKPKTLKDLREKTIQNILSAVPKKKAEIPKCGETSVRDHQGMYLMIVVAGALKPTKVIPGSYMPVLL